MPLAGRHQCGPGSGSPQRPRTHRTAGIAHRPRTAYLGVGPSAQTADEWLVLETFLSDLWAATGEEAFQFYWSHYSWQPDLAAARGKAKITADKPRRLAYWLDSAGAWAAKALLGTLAHPGLIEHGVSTSRVQPRPCFRLTGLGQAVFGKPERTMSEPSYEPKFLTVQPNHEVLAYLNLADPRDSLAAAL